MKHDSSNVTNNFKQQTKDHGNHVAPGLVFDTKKELCDNVYCENRCVDSVSGACW